VPPLAVAFVLLRVVTHAPSWGIIGALRAGVLIVLFFVIGMARQMVRARLARHDFPPDAAATQPADPGRPGTAIG
jgi:hypothetical protein